MALGRNIVIGKYLIDDNDYDKEKLLGKGGCGQVFKAKNKDTGEYVALKELFQMSDPKDQRMFVREIVVPLQLNLPGIVRMLGFRFPDLPGTVDKPKSAMILTELMTNGTLKDAVQARLSGTPNPNFGPTEWSKALFGIAATMREVHAKGAMHRDLKPENVFLDDQWEPRIADFGLAKMVANSIENTMAIGSPLFMAPDLYADGDERYDNSVDVYAYGVLVYQTFTSKIELDDGSVIRRPQQMMMKILRGARLKRVPEIPDKWWTLITSCWDQSPAKRPKFEEIVEQLLSDDSMVIPGTNMEAYNEYRQRMTERMDEDSDAAALMATINTTIKKAPGLRVSDEAARGDSLCMKQYTKSMSRSMMLGKNSQAFNRFDFKRQERATD